MRSSGHDFRSPAIPRRFLKGRAVQGEPHATAINGPVFHLRNKNQRILLHHGQYDSCKNTLNLGKVVQQARLLSRIKAQLLI